MRQKSERRCSDQQPTWTSVMFERGYSKGKVWFLLLLSQLPQPTLVFTSLQIRTAEQTLTLPRFRWCFKWGWKERKKSRKRHTNPDLRETSTCTEWSMTRSVGQMGLIFIGSPPSRLTASRMAAKSTTTGTPLVTQTTDFHNHRHSTGDTNNRFPQPQAHHWWHKQISTTTGTLLAIQITNNRFPQPQAQHRQYKQQIPQPLAIQTTDFHNHRHLTGSTKQTTDFHNHRHTTSSKNNWFHNKT